MLAHQTPNDPYHFSAEPRVVKPKTKYREAPQQQEEYLSISFPFD